MLLLILVLVLATIVLTIFAFSSSAQPKQVISRPEVKAQPTPNLEAQITLLKGQLEKAKTDYEKLQSELTLAKKTESALKAELEKFKAWDNRENTELEKIKKENLQLKQDLVNKQKETENEFAINLNLNKELADIKAKLALLEKEKTQMLDETRMLQAQITGLEKEVERQNKIILETKKKEEGTEWISKQEYNELKKQLEEKEAEIKKLQDKPNV